MSYQPAAQDSFFTAFAITLEPPYIPYRVSTYGNEVWLCLYQFNLMIIQMARFRRR